MDSHASAATSLFLTNVLLLVQVHRGIDSFVEFFFFFFLTGKSNAEGATLPDGTFRCDDRHDIFGEKI